MSLLLPAFFTKVPKYNFLSQISRESMYRSVRISPRIAIKNKNCFGGFIILNLKMLHQKKALLITV